jgi:hypothetical protein
MWLAEDILKAYQGNKIISMLRKRLGSYTVIARYGHARLIPVLEVSTLLVGLVAFCMKETYNCNKIFIRSENLNNSVDLVNIENSQCSDINHLKPNFTRIGLICQKFNSCLN